MNPVQARQAIASLRGLPTSQADEVLCAMHSSAWHAIAAELGIRLPLHGGDKPAIILGAIQRRERPAA